MSRRQKEPLRAMTEEEAAWVRRIARATREPANPGIRAKQLGAVAAGQSYSQAARLTGRRSGDAVAELVRRFNREGVPALERRGGGGRKSTYGVGEREQIVAQARRAPQPAQDGTATWSLPLLQRALRQSDPPHLGRLSTYTIWAVWQEAGRQWGRTRSWCDPGHARRKRKRGVGTVIDPETEAKKTCLSKRTPSERVWA
jgi:homeodomain-containing protein